MILDQKKTKALINLINEQHDIDKIFFNARDLNKPKYEFLIKKRLDVGIKHLNDANVLVECSNTMDDVYENIDDYNPIRKRRKWVVFDDMIADIMDNRRFQTIIKELFIRCRKLNISLAFITQSLFFCSKRCQIKFNTLFDYENRQQKGITKYCDWSFCRLWLRKFYEKLSRMQKKNLLIFWQ